MADELNISISGTLDKNGASTQFNSNDTVTQTGNAVIKQTISVGTADETLALGDVGTIGYVFLHNLDGTNYIDFGTDGTTYPIRLRAGESALFRYNSAALHAKANTAACLLEYAIIED